MKRASDTKEKILMQAHDLFSKEGFYGTSVRDIANEAGVNIAAINYHFNNKEALYWETYKFSYNLLNDGIEQLSKEAKNTAELAWLIFEHMMENGSSVTNTFKMMLNDSLTMPEDFQQTSENNFGPPGGQAIYLKLKAELPSNTPETALIWAVRGIFTYVVHWALMMTTSYCKEMKKNDPSFSPEGKKKSIELQVQAMINFIKTNSSEF